MGHCEARLLAVVTLLLALQVGNSRSGDSTGPITATEIQRALFRTYSKADPPRQGPTTLQLGIYVISLQEVNERQMDFSLSIYLRQRWIDPRLSFEHLDESGTMEKILLDEGVWHDIWIPDIFFSNEKTAKYHYITTPNRLIQLRRNGQLWYSSKLSLTLDCPMTLHRFPFDTQSCSMIIESFGKTTDSLIFGWLEQPLEFESNTDLARYSLTESVLYDCIQNFTAGAFPCHEIRFILTRQQGYYILQLFIPSGLIVVLSWITFWVSPRSGIERISIGLLAILTITTHSSSSRSMLPEVSYITAMDIWMTICLVFTIASLLQSAVVNFILEGEETKKPHPSRGNSQTDCSYGPAAQEVSNVCRCCGQPDGPTNIRHGARRAMRIDKVSRLLFPLSFGIFVVLYWVTYNCL